MATALSEKYTGKTAAEYDAKREASPKWAFEQLAVSSLIGIARPRSVLDVPVGTGRFIGLYAEMGIEATGFDVSADMLMQAESKGTVTLQQCDLFALRTRRKWDCVVCVRFLNWLPAERMARAIGIIARLSREHVVLSISSAPVAHVRHTGAFIHSEAEFAAAVDAAGLRVVTEHTSNHPGLDSRVVLLGR